MLIFSQSNGTTFCYDYSYESRTKELLTAPTKAQAGVRLTEDIFFISNYQIKEDKNNIKYLNNEILRLKKLKQIEIQRLTQDHQIVIKTMNQKFKEELIANQNNFY